jgi:uncharacterized protein Yka (UPF0111/DUF47 family)
MHVNKINMKFTSEMLENILPRFLLQITLIYVKSIWGENKNPRMFIGLHTDYRKGSSPLLHLKKKGTELLDLLIQSAENTYQASLIFQKAMHEDQPTAYIQELDDLEKKGDQITRQIYRDLDQIFVTPLDREDIITLASKIDDVIDGIEATISRFDYLDIPYTDQTMRQFAEVLVSSCEHILYAMKLLSQKKYLKIREHTIQINHLENEGNRLMREGIRAIFTNPRDPYHDFKLKEIYERLERATDCCEDVADILDSVLLRYS